MAHQNENEGQSEIQRCKESPELRSQPIDRLKQPFDIGVKFMPGSHRNGMQIVQLLYAGWDRLLRRPTSFQCLRMTVIVCSAAQNAENNQRARAG